MKSSLQELFNMSNPEDFCGCWADPKFSEMLEQGKPEVKA